MDSPPRCSNEVFLSFRGEDTRVGFVDHLYGALVHAGIQVFRDDESLVKGEDISGALWQGIKNSKISVIVFSSNYANSTWCLEELGLIMSCRTSMGQLVLPVFYGVDPSCVRHRKGRFEVDLRNHAKKFAMDKDRVMRWRTSLHDAAGIAGFVSLNMRESELVDRVRDDILSKRIAASLSISIYALRYDPIHQYLNLFLQVGTDNALLVGICGERGMGKTAIARAVFDQISFTFEGSTFLEDIAQNARMPEGLVLLQEKLLSETLHAESGGNNYYKVANVMRGMDVIKEKLCSRRVLIVLDDVDSLEQLYGLVGDRRWFGLGSKIIITTRDLRLLNAFGVDQMFQAQGLPLPPNIQAIWKQFQHSNRIIAELKHYKFLLQKKTNERERHLQQRLLEERQKNAIQE